LHKEHVPLRRLFIALSGEESEQQLFDISANAYLGVRWESVLSQPLSIILAGADSGKSWEFEWQADQLATKGLASFFVRLEDLVDGAPHRTLPQEQLNLINAWKTGAAHGWFFLDSVDEAKIRDRAAFRRAVATFAKLIGDGLDRVTVVISSRPAAWNHVDDRQEIETLFTAQKGVVAPAMTPPPVDEDELLLGPIRGAGDRGAPDDAATAPEEIDADRALAHPVVCRVFLLADLGDDDRKVLAKAWGVPNPVGLSEAAHEKRLESFTLRPGDYRDLCRYWEEHGCLAERSDMMRGRLERVLRERPSSGSGSTLTDKRAWEGARILAAALLLTNSTSLSPDGAEHEGRNAIDVADVLWDWTASDRTALLLRGLFAPELLGRIQFLNRSWIDFLAADWFRSLLERQSCRLVVQDLLFPEIWNEKTVRPELSSAACWLAIDHHWVRDEILSRKPVLLMKDGDPTTYPPEFKARILARWADMHRNGQLGRFQLETRDYKAFAEHGLEDPIRAAWTANDHLDFRVDLIELISTAGLTSCADLVRQTIEPDFSGQALVYRGCEALKGLGDELGLNRAAEHLRAGRFSADGGFLRLVIPLLYPDQLSTQDVLSLLQAMPKPRERHSHTTGRLVEQLMMQCPESDLEILAAGLTDLALRIPLTTGVDKVSDRFEHIADALMQAAPVLIGRHQCPEHSSVVVEFLMTAQFRNDDYQSKSAFQTAAALVEANELLKQALFWRDMEYTYAKLDRKEKTDRLDLLAFWRVHQTLWNLGEEDLTWLQAACAQSADEKRRAAAGACLIEHHWRNETLVANRDSVRALVKWSGGLRKMLDERLAPRKTPKWQLKEAEAEKKRRAQDAINQREWLTYRDRVKVATPPTRREGSDGEKKAYDIFQSALTRWLSWPSEHRGSLSPRGWKAIVPAWGQEAAEAYRDLFIDLWRRVEPRRPERSGSTTTYKWDVIYGFAGIGVEADADALWPASLSPTETERAVRYAVRCDRGIPDWLGRLQLYAPDVVLREVREELKREWVSSEAHHKPWLYYLANRNVSEDDFIEALVSVLVHNTCGHDDAFRLAVRALSACSLKPQTHRRLIRHARYLLSNAVALEERINAFSLFSSLDFEEASTAIADTIVALPQKDAFSFAQSMFTRDQMEVRDAATLSVASARRVLEALALQAPAQSDVSRGEEDEIRAEAQDARKNLVGLIRAKRSFAAHAALLELADNPAICRDPHWFRVMASEMAEEASALKPWEPRHVRDLETCCVGPINSSDALSQEVFGALCAIKLDFSNADTSSKPVLRHAPNEDAVQEWLCEQLQLRCRSQITAVREAQVADKKKPDIIAASSLAGAEVVVELKHANKGYTVPALEAALRTQIVGKYLKVDRRRHGILFVSLHKDRRWRPKPGVNWSFDDVIAHLSDYAAKVISECPHDIRLDVIGLDAT
jgi:hypothetical protein